MIRATSTNVFDFEYFFFFFTFSAPDEADTDHVKSDACVAHRNVIGRCSS